MILFAPNHKIMYELSNIIRLFFPGETVLEGTSETSDSAGIVRAASEPCADGQNNRVSLQTAGGLRELEERSGLSLPEQSRSMGRLLYRMLSEATGKTMEWGTLTGIRPVKLARWYRERGLTEQETIEAFRTDYLTSREKAALCVETDRQQKAILGEELPHGYSLYLSVPFCPSRCSYCSFVSHSIEKTWKLIPEYVEKMVEETIFTAKLAEQKGLRLQSVYMGGGTPTVLTAEQLDKVLGTVREHFPFEDCREFTVEAGRPDTITAEKLEVLQKHGVDRISINCQTLNDEILRQVGRKHTAEDFFRVFELAKQYHFHAVNVDLIAGLPEESEESFRNSLEQVLRLRPENVTVHSLTVKRAANLAEKAESIFAGAGRLEQSPVSRMVSFSSRRITSDGYVPYYLYRQKGTLDGLENVGYCLPGTQGRYNIYIMDETHSILSVGGGGVTKLVLPQNGQEQNIQRIFNQKYPYEYISRFEEQLEKKKQILDCPL